MRALVTATGALCAAGLIWSGSPALATPPGFDDVQQQQQQHQQQQQQPPQQMQQQQPRTTQQPLREAQELRAPAQNVAGQQRVLMTLVTSTGRIASAPAAFTGLEVSVHAAVSEVVAPGIFTLDEDQWFAGPDVLVIVPEAKASAARLNEGVYVTVVGNVRPFVRAELERDYDWFDFDNLPDFNINMSSRPVIVADIVRTSYGLEIAPAQQNVTRVYVASPGDIAEVPGRFYGRSVSVRAEVEDVRSQRLFTLDEDQLFVGPDLLVMNPFPALAPEDGEVVTVIGVVRPFVSAEFERDYDWFDANQFGVNLADYERRPVLIAHSILGRDARQLVRVTPAFTLETTERALAARRTGRDVTATAGQPGQAPAGTTGQQRPTGQQQPIGQQQPAGTAGQGALTDVGAILGITDVNQLVNRRVNLTNVQVQRVEGPRTIWVGPSAERSVMVMVAEVAGQAPTQFSMGDRVTLSGTIMRPPADATGALANAPYFVHATDVRVVK